MTETPNKPVQLRSALSKQTFSHFWHEMMKHKLQFFAIWIGLLVVVVAGTFEPFVFRKIFDTLNTRQEGWWQIVDQAFWQLVIIHVTIWFTWRIMGLCNAFFQPRIISDLMVKCYAYTLKHSQTFFAENFLGSIVSRIRRFSYSFEGVDDIIKWNLGRTAMSCLTLLIACLIFKPALGIVFVGWVSIFIWFAYWYSQKKMPYDLKTANQDTLVTAQISDKIANVSNVHRFGSVEREIKKFKVTADELAKRRLISWLIGQLSEAIQGVSMVVLFLGMIYYSLQQAKNNIYSVGDLAAIAALLGQFSFYLWDLGRQIRSLYEHFADANEMTVMLNIPHEIVDEPEAKNLVVSQGLIQFENLGFNYGDESVFTEFSLRINPGERVALVGKSGAGKTTLMNLLLRKLTLQSGRILIDGQDITHVAQESLRQNIATVLQDFSLFHDTIFGNIQYPRPDATREEVLAAAKAAHCDEFVLKLENGYDTIVGERGLKLSGGQRQRVAIAQALLMKARIMVLDEATSSLDSESEHYVQESLKQLMSGCTTLVIAHRLSTIKEMDRILVLSCDGKIVEQGTHDELSIKEGGHYSKLWARQAGGFIKSISA